MFGSIQFSSPVYKYDVRGRRQTYAPQMVYLSITNSDWINNLLLEHKYISIIIPILLGCRLLNTHRLHTKNL